MTASRRSSGSTSEQARQYNERIILQCVRREAEVSRAQLAKHTALSAQTISVITASLIDRQLLRVVGRAYGGRGQPSIKLALNPRGAFGVGVNLDRDHISTSLVDFTGRLLHKHDHEQRYPSVDQALALVAADLAQMQSELGGEWQRVRGVGLAIPRNMGGWGRELDLVSELAEQDERIRAHQQQWSEVDFAGHLRRLSGLAVTSENDAGAAALAELLFGLGHRFSSFFYVFFGLALGGGIISDGQYFRGSSGNAADLGVFPVAGADGLPAGMLMSEVSLSSLYRYLRERGVSVETPEQLCQLLGQSEELTIDGWVAQAAVKLCGPLLSVMAMLDTEALVFGGRLPSFILEKIVVAMEQLFAQWDLPAQASAECLLSQTGLDAGAIGAAILPLYETYAPMRERLLVKHAPGK